MFNRSKLYRLCAATGVTVAIMVGAATAAVAQQVTVIGPRQFEQVRHVRIQYADLDLTAAAGYKQLMNRVGWAARRACNPGSFRTLLTPGEYVGCFDGALTEARPQVDRAVDRARQLSATGTSAIPAVAISFTAAF
jgi:UrcA family protein